MASRVSNDLALVVAAPNGKPTTAIGLVEQPCRSRAAVARSVVNGGADRGIVLGGSGQGEQIAANKVDGARAALCNDLYTARLSRQHNDANVLSMGARVIAPTLAREIVQLWLGTPFEGGRHVPRLEQIAAIERGEL